MAQKAMYTGVDSIMKAFEYLADGSPYYSVWFTERNLAFAYNESDYDKGQKLLEEFLEGGAQNDHNEILTIKFHPEQAKKYIDKTTPVKACTYVRCTQLKNIDYTGAVTGIAGAPYGMKEVFDALSGLKELPGTIGGIIDSKIDERLKALELAESNIVEVDPIDKWMERLSTPAVSGFLTELITMAKPFFASFSAPAMVVPAIGKVSGVTPEPATGEPVLDQELMESSLERLHKKGFNIDTDLNLLANLAEKNELMFNGLLAQLRST